MVVLAVVGLAACGADMSTDIITTVVADTTTTIAPPPSSTTTTTAPTTTTTHPPADSCRTIGKWRLRDWNNASAELWGEIYAETGELPPMWRVGKTLQMGEEDIQPGERVCIVTFEPPTRHRISEELYPIQFVVCGDWLNFATAGQPEPGAARQCLSILRGGRE